MRSRVTAFMEFLGSNAEWRHAFTDAPLSTVPPPRPRGLPTIDLLAPRVSIDGEVLGQGGMGVVAAAKQTRIPRSVAVKTLLPADREDDEARAALLQEAWIAGALEHPSVVPVYDIEIDDHGRPLVVMKKIEGTSWHKVLHEQDATRPDPLAFHLGVLMRVCDAVELAHSRGVIHRDIKPANVMLGRYGEVYLLDWGLAVALDDDRGGRFPLAKHVTRPAGTPGYMAPEQLDDNGDRLGTATDVFLLGATLYEIVSGRPPHQGPDLASRVHSVLHGPAPLPETTPKALAQIIGGAMALDPKARPQRAADIKQAITDFLAHRGSERIAEAAFVATKELEDAAHQPLDDGSVQRAVRLFSEARFGFRLAKEAWPQNPETALGLERALRAAVEIMLRAGSPETASALVGAVSSVPDDLKARVSRAVDDARLAQERLKAAARDYDIHIGQRVRAVFALLVGVLATVHAIVVHTRVVVQGSPRTPEIGILVAALFLVVVLVIRVMFRKNIDTLLNKKFLRLCVVATSAGVALRLGLWALDTDPYIADVMVMCVWSLAAGCAASALEPRLTPAAIVYGVGFAAAVLDPDLRFLMHGAGHVVLAINGWWVLNRRRA